MMDVTFGDLPVATDFANADLVACWQATTTMTVPKSVFLQAKAGEEISLQTAGGTKSGFDAASNTVINIEAGKFLRVQRGTDIFVQILSAGSLLLTAKTGQAVFVADSSGAGGLYCDGAGNVQVTAVAGTPVNVQYVPANSADWIGDPAWEKDALDRIAAEVAILKGGPIT